MNLRTPGLPKTESTIETPSPEESAVSARPVQSFEDNHTPEGWKPIPNYGPPDEVIAVNTTTHAVVCVERDGRFSADIIAENAKNQFIGFSNDGKYSLFFLQETAAEITES